MRRVRHTQDPDQCLHLRPNRQSKNSMHRAALECPPLKRKRKQKRKRKRKRKRVWRSLIAHRQDWRICTLHASHAQAAVAPPLTKRRIGDRLSTQDKIRAIHRMNSTTRSISNHRATRHTPDQAIKDFPCDMRTTLISTDASAFESAKSERAQRISAARAMPYHHTHSEAVRTFQ